MFAIQESFARFPNWRSILELDMTDIFSNWIQMADVFVILGKSVVCYSPVSVIPATSVQVCIVVRSVTFCRFSR